MRPTQTALVLALPLIASCGSAPKATSQSTPAAPAAVSDGGETSATSGTNGPTGGAAAAEPAAGAAAERADRFAPIPEPEWTGAFRERSVLLARTIRVEGPAPLLSHMVASSDDAYFDRSVQTTPDGLLQVVRRASDEVEIVKGHLDAWRLAAEDRIVILERVAPGPVVVIADGEVMWRDADGAIERSDRLEFTGEIGNMTPARPGGASGTPAEENDAAETPDETPEGSTDETAAAAAPR